MHPTPNTVFLKSEPATLLAEFLRQAAVRTRVAVSRRCTLSTKLTFAFKIIIFQRIFNKIHYKFICLPNTLLNSIHHFHHGPLTN